MAVLGRPMASISVCTSAMVATFFSFLIFIILSSLATRLLFRRTWLVTHLDSWEDPVGDRLSRGLLVRL
jgi:hypothetical protein